MPMIVRYAIRQEKTRQVIKDVFGVMGWPVEYLPEFAEKCLYSGIDQVVQEINRQELRAQAEQLKDAATASTTTEEKSDGNQSVQSTLSVDKQSTLSDNTNDKAIQADSQGTAPAVSEGQDSSSTPVVPETTAPAAGTV